MSPYNFPFSILILPPVYKTQTDSLPLFCLCPPSDSSTHISSQNSSMASSMASSKSLLDLNEIEYEQVLHDAFHKAKGIARTDAFTDEVLIAKLAVLAIRQLHASDVYPRTAIRAMVLMEFDEENRTTGGAIARAKRDIRDEDRARRAEAGPARAGPPSAMLANAGQRGPPQQKA
ncbi:hypothetical protein DV736_g6229, partial [Chaetothyriales sp. CBS 134916]